MNDKFNKALNDYADKFDDNFPTFMFSSKSPEEIIEIVNECVEKNKDIYDIGYLKLDDDILY